MKKPKKGRKSPKSNFSPVPGKSAVYDKEAPVPKRYTVTYNNDVVKGEFIGFLITFAIAAAELYTGMLKKGKSHQQAVNKVIRDLEKKPGNGKKPKKRKMK